MLPFFLLILSFSEVALCIQIGCNGDLNAMASDRPTSCPPTCAQPDTQDLVCNASCDLLGCMCKEGYILSENKGQCILPQKCPGGSPSCGENKTYVDCLDGCPTNNCPVDDNNAAIVCDIAYPCSPGCACKAGYLKLSYEDPTCIKSSECPPVNCTRPNEVWDSAPSNCLDSCGHINLTCHDDFPSSPKCVCISGFNKNGTDTCVSAPNCDKGCKGDQNAVPNSCPSSCPATCDEPSSNDTECIAVCGLSGCECKPGYILTKYNGTCVKRENCPGGSPSCGENETHVDCFDDCPTNYCPVDDNNAAIACDIAYPCSPGCACKAGYLKLSYEDPTCIKSSECPPVNCTRPNEVWDCAPSNCLDSCGHINLTCHDDFPSSPKCVCISGFYRNGTDTCVSAPNCDKGCKGDQNAVPNSCPSSCPATCDEPSSNDTECTAVCGLSGCECKPGYILTKYNGTCVKRENCPGGSPSCGENETHVDCFDDCPTNYCPVDDNNAAIACDIAYPCSPGCACKAGYLKLSYEDPTCIKSSECPPVNCTRPNEVWDSAPSNCLDSCGHINLTCHDDFPSSPKCVCISGFYKNGTDTCVSAPNCDKGCKGDQNAVPNSCPSSCPATCDEPSSNDTECTAVCGLSGCECKPGYILTKYNGTCVKRENCPATGCKGDPNAMAFDYPTACPPTCAQPETRDLVFNASCNPNDCICNEGYILSEIGGRCILPKECPGGFPACLGNKTYVDCFVDCPDEYCSADNRNGILICDPAYPCLPGCTCMDGYLTLSSEDHRCVLSSDCPLPQCGENEEASACAITCPPQTCESLYTEYLCAQTTHCSPGCNCIDKYLRNDLGKCIPSDQCLPDIYHSDFHPKRTTTSSVTWHRRWYPRVKSHISSTTSSYSAGSSKASNSVSCNTSTSSHRSGARCEPSCSKHERYVTDDVSCIKTCENRLLPWDTMGACVPYTGCACDIGFIRKYGNGTGPCVLEKYCPNQQCSDPNASPKDCPSSCQPTCEQPDTSGVICTMDCLPGGCVCNSGFILNQTGGICIKKEDCPCNSNQQCSDPNASPKDCPSSCQPTCEQPDTSGVICTTDCLPGGCVCNSGFILNQTGGICIKKEDCPCNSNQQCSDPNASPKDCPSSCQPTCEQPDTSGVICTMDCLPGGCVCNSGFILNQTGGICIKKEDCPCNSTGCKGDPNAVASDCPSACPPTCAQPDTRDVACIASCDLSGCVCKEGYILSEIGEQCILPEKCPGGSPLCPYNKTFVGCYVGCPTRYCPVNGRPDVVICDPPYPCPPGCACEDGYLMLSAEDRRCVLASECPTGCNGDPNAEPNSCPSYCPPTCDEPSSDDTACIEACAPSGCSCKPGYILTKYNGTCVKPEECPATGCNGDPNAEPNSCPSYCPPTCDEPSSDDTACIEVCAPSGCSCKPGYILTTYNGTCVKPEECPAKGCNSDPNAEPNSCPSYCPPTCDEPNSGDIECIAACDPSGCSCKPGYILTKYNGRCVKPEECPGTGCNGDPNAVPHSCPSSCPPTCDEPSSEGKLCIAACDPSGCVCKPGYILTKYHGKCVKPEECPVKSLQCGLNEVAVECRTICPPQNCEISYTEYACSQSENICEPGCDCLPNYLRNSSGICIPNGECPYPTSPNCGVNEIATDCRKICPPQTCESRFALYKCSGDIPCEAGCDCMPNYLRNSEGVCVPTDQCDASPPTTCSIPDECIRTCEWPNPPNCPYQAAKANKDGCECMEGYILSEIGGKCIKIEDCPSNKTCNGDPHARAKSCPAPCPSTCESPNAVPCKKMCEPIGCECEPGYLFSKLGGQCILPEDCPGGNPCPENSDFRPCKYNCPQDYCPMDENSDNIVCDPPPFCLSGCVCKLNYRKLSYEDNRCIVASDCPPVNCTRPNEVWNGCPSECFSGYCEDREYQNVTCNTFVLNCQPKCVCKWDTFRNASGICVPASECPPLCSVPEECRRTCSSPNPSNCSCEPATTNNDGCECMEGYLLSDIGGSCIKVEDCPVY